MTAVIEPLRIYNDSTRGTTSRCCTATETPIFSSSPPKTTNNASDFEPVTSNEENNTEMIDTSVAAANNYTEEQLQLYAGNQQQSYGGLVNMGNTCYAAASLQLLATMKPFVQSLLHNNRDHLNHNSKSSSLIDAFVHLVNRLEQGETFEPKDLKEIIDAKSPFFVGYEQQDAHEFLTTLLDLMDYDYKAQMNDESEENNNKTGDNVQLTETEPMIQDTEQPINSKKDEDKDNCLSDDNTMRSDDSSSTPSKRARIGEIGGSSDVDDSTLSTRGSFSQLDCHGIGYLLHNRTPAPTLVLPAIAPQQPRCKLMGGRMNPSPDTSLMPYSTKREHDEVADEAASTPSINEEESNSISFQATNADPQKSPVDDFFTTTCRIRITCDSCKYTRLHAEVFRHLSLDLVGMSVDDGLRRFFAPERRELKCEKCFFETATQTMQITELPKALLLHFKRFLVDTSSDYCVSYRKNRSVITLDAKLSVQDLEEFMAPECRVDLSSSYQLSSIVNHIGSSTSCGHYTANCLRRYIDGSFEWTRFNDDIVTRISSQEALEESQQTAYMVLYELE
jgi:ubiquitin C-terminal hydrolase